VHRSLALLLLWCVPAFAETLTLPAPGKALAVVQSDETGSQWQVFAVDFDRKQLASVTPRTFDDGKISQCIIEGTPGIQCGVMRFSADGKQRETLVLTLGGGSPIPPGPGPPTPPGPTPPGPIPPPPVPNHPLVQFRTNPLATDVGAATLAFADVLRVHPVATLGEFKAKLTEFYALAFASKPNAMPGFSAALEAAFVNHFGGDDGPLFIGEADKFLKSAAAALGVQ
jgi:hypothetical protein